MIHRFRWLLLALLLFGLVALLMPSSETSRAGTEATAAAVFPRYPNYQQHRRMLQRRTLPPLRDVVPGDGKPRERDPVLVAMSAQAESLVVIESSAFFRLPAGRMLLDCVNHGGGLEPLKRHGLQLEKVDRIAMVDPGEDQGMLILSGDMSQVDVEQLFKVSEPRAYGDHARILRSGAAQQPLGAGGAPAENRRDGRPTFVAVWDQQLMLAAERADVLESAIDRLEGRLVEAAAFDQNKAYSEAYGRLSGRKIVQRLLPQAVGNKVAASAMRFDFHVDARADALLVVDGFGDKDQSRDIGRMLAAALAARRVQAVAQGDERLSRLLDLYSVRMHDDGFQLEAAFPLDYLQSALGDCAKQAGGTSTSAGAGPGP